MNTQSSALHAEQEQAEASRYAHLLDWGAHIGLSALIVSFAAYVFGFLTPLVPLEQLPSVWNLPLATYLQRTGTPTGWGWVALAHKGDFSNLIGISLLAGCSLAPLVGLIFLYIKRRDFVYAVICALVLMVLVLAASGILTGRH
jgi:VIT1/CCC1 family predicted Fe2+/Mn2+ transporter